MATVSHVQQNAVKFGCLTRSLKFGFTQSQNYTQYIPVSLYELMGWIGTPSIYVFDCPAAGTIVYWFLQFAEQYERNEVCFYRALILPESGLCSRLPTGLHSPGSVLGERDAPDQS